MSQYFPKPYEPFIGDINNLLLETLISKLIYLIIQQKLYLKNVSHVDACSFALK